MGNKKAGAPGLAFETWGTQPPKKVHRCLNYHRKSLLPIWLFI